MPNPDGAEMTRTILLIFPEAGETPAAQREKFFGEIRPLRAVRMLVPALTTRRRSVRVGNASGMLFF